MTTLLFCVIFLSVTAQQWEIDFHALKNKQVHNTVAYRVPDDTLVLRRSATFAVTVTGGSNFAFQVTPVDSLTKKPFGHGIDPIQIPVVPQIDPSAWGAQTENGADFIISIPTSAVVSLYSFQIVAGSQIITTDQFIATIFNPWSRDDAVYLGDSAARNEYVLNEQGAMWLSSGRASGWTFDQFDDDVFSVTLWLLNLMHWDYRNDVIKVSRHLSSVLNANNGKGLMYGRWQEPYTGGKVPWYWTGSAEIFKLFRPSLTPVRYAQCWVFAGVMVSSGRTIGIPARQITNFNSGHEDGNLGPYRLSIDFFSDKDGNQVSQLGSIWNFHAWIEYWFNRVDLNTTGWQIGDATPQETSDGAYQLGPTSQLAVKNAQIDIRYDTAFVASETNAAVRQYVPFNTGKPPHPFKSGYWLSEETLSACGRDITTKAIGSNSPDVITRDYKFARLAKPHPLLQSRAPSVDITFHVVQPQAIRMGDSLHLTLMISCPTCSQEKNRFVQVATGVRILSYDGSTKAQLLTNLTTLALTNNLAHNISFLVTRNMYQQYLSFEEELQSNLFAKVFDEKSNFTGEYYTQMKQYEIVEPEIDIDVEDIQATYFTLDVLCPNPLGIPLNNTSVSISGAYIVNQELSVGEIKPDTVLRVGPVKVDLLPAGWPAKGWISAYVRVDTDQVSHMDVLAVIFQNGKVKYISQE